MSLLEVAGLGKSYGGVQAVKDFSFHLNAGERLAMIGPNGAGKSTCFNMLSGQILPERGTITFNGADITGWPPRRIWRLGVGRTFQIPATYSSMTVAENVQMALLSRGRRLGSLWTVATTLFRQEAFGLLKQVGLTGQAERPCGVLSYGDVKSLELAIALAHQPKLLLMDEPTAGMASQERHVLMQLISQLAAEQGVAVLFTEHSMDVVFGYADRVMVLARGELIATGGPEEVRDNALVREVYLGESTAEETVP